MKKQMSQTQDSTFYRTPADTIAAPEERLAYVAAFDPTGQVKDAIAVLDTDSSSPDYGQVVGWSELPTARNELHHFGWNACSSALCHTGHAGHLERRYLIVPGLRSSRTYVLDTKPHPLSPRVVRTVLVGAGLMAAATVAGAWLAHRLGHREIWLAAAAGALLIIAGLHLLPDAWSAASTTEIWSGLVPITAVAAFTAAGLAARLGCACHEQKESASDTGTAAAVAVHRFLEGSAIALAGSAAVAVALAMHAFGEGLAAGALLGTRPRRHVAG